MLFLAGFDNLGLGLSQILHNLVKHQDVQDKVIQEIDEALEKSDGEITYDLVDDLQYMDMVIRETFRWEFYISRLSMMTFFLQGTKCSLLSTRGSAPRITSFLIPTLLSRRGGSSTSTLTTLSMIRKITLILGNLTRRILTLRINLTSLPS